jgi:hypothetical protein
MSLKGVSLNLVAHILYNNPHHLHQFFCNPNPSVNDHQGSMTLVSQVHGIPHFVSLVSKLMADLGI